MLSCVHTIKSDICKDLDIYIKELEQLKSDLNQEYNRFELDVREHLDYQDKQNSNREIQMFNYIKSIKDIYWRYQIINNISVQ